jgi:hypothetical protein
MRAGIGGTKNYPDDTTLFHVSDGKITTYAAEDTSSFLTTKFNFVVRNELNITKDHSVETSAKYKDGSGLCKIFDNKGSKQQFYIYKHIDRFVQEVEREIINAPN